MIMSTCTQDKKLKNIKVGRGRPQIAYRLMTFLLLRDRDNHAWILG